MKYILSLCSIKIDSRPNASGFFFLFSFSFHFIKHSNSLKYMIFLLFLSYCCRSHCHWLDILQQNSDIHSIDTRFFLKMDTNSILFLSSILQTFFTIYGFLKRYKKLFQRTYRLQCICYDMKCVYSFRASAWMCVCVCVCVNKLTDKLWIKKSS